MIVEPPNDQIQASWPDSDYLGSARHARTGRWRNPNQTVVRTGWPSSTPPRRYPLNGIAGSAGPRGLKRRSKDPKRLPGLLTAPHAQTTALRLHHSRLYRDPRRSLLSVDRTKGIPTCLALPRTTALLRFRAAETRMGDAPAAIRFLRRSISSAVQGRLIIANTVVHLEPVEPASAVPDGCVTTDQAATAERTPGRYTVGRARFKFRRYSPSNILRKA